MKKSISKTIVTIAIVTAFLMPLMGNTALADTTATFYFNSYNPLGESWETNPSYMADGNENTYASTTTDGDVQLLNDNTCNRDSGSITKVEIRAKGYYLHTGDSADIILRAVYSGGDGFDHTFDAPSGLARDWSAWFDITTDMNAPNPWTWTNVANLDCDVEADGSGEFMLSGSKVEIQVTYTSR